MEARPRVLSSHSLSFFPPSLLAAALFCFEPQNEFLGFPVSQKFKCSGLRGVSIKEWATTRTRGTMNVGACTGIVGGFHRWLLFKDTQHDMKWLLGTVKCTITKMQHHNLKLQKKKDCFAAGNGHGRCLQQFAGANEKIAALRLSWEKLQQNWACRAHSPPVLQ